MKKSLFFFTILYGAMHFQAVAATKCFVAKEGRRVLALEGNCAERASPCSTFEIVINLMGYDSGILKDKRDPESLDGESDAQRIMQSLSLEVFQSYVKKLNYGNKNIAGDKGKKNGWAHSWLSSSLKISPFEQITFLTKLIYSELPVSRQAQDFTRQLIYREELPNGWKLFGKTGTGLAQNKQSVQDDGPQIGWFIGWVVKEKHVIVFAHLIEGQKVNGKEAFNQVKERLLPLLESCKNH
jgi:beta-lactamase class D OXA-29